MATNQAKLLWTPSDETIQNANLTQYLQWLLETKDLTFENYWSLWQWSVDHLEDFWESILVYFEVPFSGSYQKIIKGSMPETNWFEGISLNYAENIFRMASQDRPAIVHQQEHNELKEISWSELETSVAAFRYFLEQQGVKKGDAVAGYIANIPEAAIAFLAANSLGAVWASTSPDFGTRSVIDRLEQIQPIVLVASSSYKYGGKEFSRSAELKEIAQNIISIKTVVTCGHDQVANTVHWDIAVSQPKQKLVFDRVPFSHPIWVLYSSGTTGKPKAMTHSHGGILLEHLKYLNFHQDVHPGERCFWYSTTGWMMWNYTLASWLGGSTVVLFDGSPTYPNINALWKFVENARVTHFGTSAGYIIANLKANVSPSTDFKLNNLRSIGSTGSPLPPEGFDWIYEHVKKDLWLTSISGGSDVCSAFVGGNPLLPVYTGEIQCRALGCDLQAFDEDGNPILGEVGEMVITKPMPSMPVYFWSDRSFKKYRESYYSDFEGVWRHGDWTEITTRNGVIIHGRSDSTLNRGGVRIGTSEIYRAVDKIPQIIDSLVVCIDHTNGSQSMPLFVHLKDNVTLNAELISDIKTTIRSDYSPRHVPDKIFEVQGIPYTISGKKMESPIKKLLMGIKPSQAFNIDAMKNPEVINTFANFIGKI